MIKLSQNICVGQTVVIPHLPSWQAEDAGIEGEYIVFGFNANGYSDDVMLKKVSDGSCLMVPKDNVRYFAGKKVIDPEDWTIIHPDDYQPELTDSFGFNYHTEDNEEFGFWYVGSCGDYRTLHSSMVDCDWCYGTMPWNV